MAGNRQVVDPPSFTPTPFGLLTTVEWVTTGDDHWRNGITYQPTCGLSVTGVGSSTYDPCIAVTGSGGGPPGPPNLANTVTTAPRGATSFTPYVEFDCPPVGNAADNALAVAQRALAMAEPWQVEYGFWTGLAGGIGGQQTVVFPHLAATSQVNDAIGINLQQPTVVITGIGSDTMNIESALGLLEGALANCYDGVGVIHVPQMMTPTLDAWGVIKQQGPVMRTLNGNKVAIGAGYPGSSPSGAARAGGFCWIYATGNVFGYRSDVRVRAPYGAQAMDRSTNTMRMIAERTYVLGWDCCPSFAIQAAVGVPKGT